jgi:hypothetical protein
MSPKVQYDRDDRRDRWRLAAVLVGAAALFLFCGFAQGAVPSQAPMPDQAPDCVDCPPSIPTDPSGRWRWHQGHWWHKDSSNRWWYCRKGGCPTPLPGPFPVRCGVCTPGNSCGCDLVGYCTCFTRGQAPLPSFGPTFIGGGGGGGGRGGC